MKITKLQLENLVRQTIRKTLKETMRLPKKPNELGSPEDAGMSRDELSAHLAAERDKKQRKDVQKRRAAVRGTTRGMELESGHELDEAARSGFDYLQKLRDRGFEDTQILEELVKAMSRSEAEANFQHIIDMWDLDDNDDEDGLDDDWFR